MKQKNLSYNMRLFVKPKKDLMLVLPQESILGLLLFNIYSNDLFFLLEDVRKQALPTIGSYLSNRKQMIKIYML